MATRSIIARETRNGLEGIYCHWDGHPKHNGKILINHYNSDGLAELLISHGHCSSLRDTVFDSVFYARDKGELLGLEVFMNHNDMIEEYVDIEYYYIFNASEKRWQCFDNKGYELNLEEYFEEA